MLSISDPIKSANGAVDYYTNKSVEAYYTEGKVGRFYGGAVESLGLPETVNPETFHSLLMGYSPDGSRELVKNAGAADRTCGWDLTFSAPKSVSRLWATLPEAERKGIEADHRDAVETTLKIAEEMFGISRSGQGGKVHERAKLLFAVFDEYTSRANDMQIHSHCVLANTAVKPNGKTGALHSINFFRAKMLLGAIYQVTYAANLKRRHQLNIKAERVSFSIEGVPKHLCRLDSKRRIAVEEAMAARGVVSAEAAKVAAKETRPAKKYVPLKKLFPYWQQTGTEKGFGPEEALKLIHARTQTEGRSFEQAINSALDRMPKADRTKRNLLRAVRTAAMETGASGKQTLAVLKTMRALNGEPVVWTPLQNTKELRQTRQQPVKTRKPVHAQAKVKSPAQKNYSNTHKQTYQRRTETILPPALPRDQEHRTKAEGQASVRPHNRRHKAIQSYRLEPQNQTKQQTGHAEMKLAREHKSERQQTHTNTQSQRANNRSEQTSDRQNASNARGREQTRAKTSAQAHRPSRLQQRRNLEFERRFGAVVDRIFPERQTRERLTKLAHALTKKYGADRETLRQTLDTMRPGAERSFVHVEKPRLFSKSPIDSLKWLRVPKIAVGNKPHKWGDIIRKQNLPVGELRVQKRRLFPSAPQWSPLHGIEIPSLRFSLKRTNTRFTQASKEAAKRVAAQKQAAARTKSKTKESSQSQ